MAAAEVHRAARAKPLGEIDLVALSRTRAVAPRIVVRARGIVEGEVAARAVAIGGKTDVGACLCNVALKVQADAVAGHRIVSAQTRARVGHIGTEGADRGVDGCTGQHRLVRLTRLRTAEQGQAVADATRVGAFGKPQGLHVAAGIAQHASRGTEAGRADPQCLWHRRKTDREALFAAVGFGHGDNQVTTEVGRVQVFDQERTRRDVGLVDDVAVLVNAHHCIAFGDAAYRRCIAAQ
ncbi:hypothetical protein D3C75_636880 [compost metagenome]